MCRDFSFDQAVQLFLHLGGGLAVGESERQLGQHDAARDQGVEIVLYRFGASRRHGYRQLFVSGEHEGLARSHRQLQLEQVLGAVVEAVGDQEGGADKPVRG